MKPLKVAVITKPSTSKDRERRNMGYFSYDVPELVWEYVAIGGTIADGRAFRGYDLIVHEDGGNWCDWVGPHPPVMFLVIDSTLSDDHYKVRLEQARKSDLVLVDHDRTDRFRASGKRVYPFPYCVNDHVFHPGNGERDIDVVYNCASGARHGLPGGEERSQLRAMLGSYMQAAGGRLISGAVGLDEYAQNMGRARIIVNWPRTQINRPHRVFDAMASGAMLLTGPLPYVEGDFRISGVHYHEFETFEECLQIVGITLREDTWRAAAENGYKLVMDKHTWAVRAKQLREIASREFGI